MFYGLWDYEYVCVALDLDLMLEERMIKEWDF